MKTTVKQLESEVLGVATELQKFERGNKSAGTRARKHLANIKSLASEMRKEIQSIKNK